MPRRKSKKPRRQFEKKSIDSASNRMFTTTIEEDLRQQRLQQKERERKESESQSHSEFKMVEEENDVEPFDRRQVQRQDILLRGTSTTHINDLVRLPSLSLCFIQNESPLLLPHSKTKIRNLWHSKYLLENAQVTSRASCLYNPNLKWRSHTLPDGTMALSDMTCKDYLHPAARTLDVASNDMGYLPTIATCMQGGFGLFSWSRQRKQPRFQMLRGRKVLSIRLHEKSGRCGTIVQCYDGDTRYKFQYYSDPSASSFVDIELQDPVTDFCFGQDLVIFASPRYFRGRSVSPVYVTLEDGREGTLMRCLNVQNFPQSDALRVEMTCNAEKMLAFGHRNGEVSFLDLRQSRSVCSILQHIDKDSSSHLGSATDFTFLPNKQVLVKRSFGSCQLHDVRQTSSVASTSLIYNLTVPFGKSLSTRSATCNGLVVDPTNHQTLITPYIDDNYEACLGLWSLQSGIFVGNKSLGPNPEKQATFVELCQKTTASFGLKGSIFGSNDYTSSSFGVWLKCGRFSYNESPKFSSLHHLSFPGSYD